MNATRHQGIMEGTELWIASASSAVIRRMAIPGRITVGPIPQRLRTLMAAPNPNAPADKTRDITNKWATREARPYPATSDIHAAAQRPWSAQALPMLMPERGARRQNRGSLRRLLYV